jgi:hypothetical protein
MTSGEAENLRTPMQPIPLARMGIERWWGDARSARVARYRPLVPPRPELQRAQARSTNCSARHCWWSMSAWRSYSRWSKKRPACARMESGTNRGSYAATC